MTEAEYIGSELQAADTRIQELEARLKEVAHAYDVTFKRRTELELMLTQLLGDLDAEFGAWRVDANWSKLRELAKKPMTYPQTLPNGDVQDPEEDSELLQELFVVLEKHDVDEGLRETIMEMVAHWELERK